MCIESTKEKIKKLLRLSESPNEFEAQRAIMKAQELACKFNIEIENINVEDDEEFVVDESVTSKKTVSAEEMAISSIIARNFRVEAYILDGYRSKKIKVIGLKEDVEIFKTVFDYALKSFRKFRREFISEYKKTHQYFNTTAVKNSYLFGFVKGLDDKFKENVIEHALIVVTPALVKQHVNDRNFTKSRRSKRTVSRDSNVRNQGYADGRKSAM